jgi:hypothetical protein
LGGLACPLEEEPLEEEPLEEELGPRGGMAGIGGPRSILRVAQGRETETAPGGQSAKGSPRTAGVRWREASGTPPQWGSGR